MTKRENQIHAGFCCSTLPNKCDVQVRIPTESVVTLSDDCADSCTSDGCIGDHFSGRLSRADLSTDRYACNYSLANWVAKSPLDAWKGHESSAALARKGSFLQERPKGRYTGADDALVRCQTAVRRQCIQSNCGDAALYYGY